MNAPEVWWSPSLAEDLSQGGLIERTGPDLWHQENGLWHRLAELPADAVRLVREEDVDDLRLRLWQEQDAARAAGIPRGSIVAAQSVVGNILMNAPESMSLQEIAVAIVDEVAGALAVLPGDAGAVPDTGQAREPGIAERAAKLGAAVHQERADQLATGLMALADDMRSMAGQWPDNAAARNAYGVAEMRARNLVAADRETENHFRPEPSGDTVQAAVAAAQAPESPTDSTPKAGRWGSGEAETAIDTVQAPDVASRVDTELMLLGRAIEKMAGYDNDVQAPWVVERIGLIRALIGTDTTPDRLAWISEAGETAAAERQAHYQETACARRPAATSGDTDPLRAGGRRFCEGDCSCGHDHERHGPEVPGCIECSCRITPEAPDA